MKILRMTCFLTLLWLGATAFAQDDSGQVPNSESVHNDASPIVVELPELDGVGACKKCDFAELIRSEPERIVRTPPPQDPARV